MKEWKYPSSSGPGEYAVKLHDGGLLECDCRGYLIKKEGKPRFCRHTDDVIKKLKLNIVQRGDLRYVVDDLVLLNEAEIIPQKDHSQRYVDSMSAGYVNPMLASAITDRKKNEPWETTLKPFQDGNYVAEIKYDGLRVIAAKGDSLKFWSRPKAGKGEIGLDCDHKIGPHVKNAIAQLLPRGTFDGELIAGDTAKSYDATRNDDASLAKQIYIVFDILRFDGKDLCGLTYRKRRQLLEQAIPDNPFVRIAEMVDPTVERLQKLWDGGAEGIILKRLDSTYKPGWRSPHWRKVKIEFYTKGRIVGYEAAKNGPYSKVLLESVEGVETSVKTKDNYWLREFAQNPDKYIGKWLVFKHYGPTPDGKYRGPIIWDHWASEYE